MLTELGGSIVPEADTCGLFVIGRGGVSLLSDEMVASDACFGLMVDPRLLAGSSVSGKLVLRRMGGWPSSGQEGKRVGLGVTIGRVGPASGCSAKLTGASIESGWTTGLVRPAPVGWA